MGHTDSIEMNACLNPNHFPFGPRIPFFCKIFCHQSLPPPKKNIILSISSVHYCIWFVFVCFRSSSGVPVTPAPTIYTASHCSAFQDVRFVSGARIFWVKTAVENILTRRRVFLHLISLDNTNGSIEAVCSNLKKFLCVFYNVCQFNF